MSNPHMTVSEAAKELNMSPMLIRELMKRERLPIGYALKREGKGRWYFVIYRKLVEEHRKEIIG